MKNPFHDPIAVKKKEDGDYPWSFKAPSYDNRTSCSLAAGDDYGVGHKNPVGKETARPISSGPIPQRPKAFSAEEVVYAEKQG